MRKTGMDMAGLWRDVRGSLEGERFARALRDRWTWAALALGCVGLPFTPGPMPTVWRLALAALTEELAYRALVQEQLEEMLPGRRGPCTAANALASGIFALSHLPTHSPLMAGLTFFPSLVFGALWTRHRSLWLCATVHLWYNLLFFL